MISRGKFRQPRLAIKGLHLTKLSDHDASTRGVEL